MSIGGDAEAVAVLIRWSQTSGVVPWTFLKYPDGSPYFRLRVAAPFEAILAPQSGSWFLARIREAKIPPRYEPLVSTTAPAEAVIGATIRTLRQFAVDERDAREIEASDAYAQAARELADVVGETFSRFGAERLDAFCSVGRASGLHRECHRFVPGGAHLASDVRTPEMSGLSVGKTDTMTDQKPGGEPFAYMSSSNYRGLRSPWSILLLATIMLALGLFIVVAPLVTAGDGLWVAGYFMGVAFALIPLGVGAVACYIGIKRLRWMRSVSMSTLHPVVRNQRSSWGRMLPPDDQRPGRSG